MPMAYRVSINLAEFNLAHISWIGNVFAQRLEHENHLLNHRLSWLVTSHIFLFGAFVGIFSQSVLNRQAVSVQSSISSHEFFDIGRVVLLTIPVFGFFVCLIINGAARTAALQVERLERWWFAHYVFEIVDPKELTTQIDTMNEHAYLNLAHPPINGIFRGNYYRIWSSCIISSSRLFMAAWIILESSIYY